MIETSIRLSGTGQPKCQGVLQELGRIDVEVRTCREGWPVLPGTFAMVRDRNNIHDSNAIRVLWGETHIGWIPKKQNATLALAMDRGKRFDFLIRTHGGGDGFNRGAEILLDLLPHTSFSSADDYFQCPSKWAELKLHGLPDEPGMPAVLGSVAHHGLETAYGLPQGSRERLNPVAVAKHALKTYEARGSEAAIVEQITVDQVTPHIVAGLVGADGVDVIGLETTLEPARCKIGGVPFKGFIDRVEKRTAEDGTESVVVVDLKTGKVPKKPYREGKFRQILLYAAGLQAQDGIEATSGELVYTGFREKIPGPTTIPYQMPAIGWLQTQWAGMEQGVATGNFETKTGPLCPWCPAALECGPGLAEVEKRIASGRVRHDAPAVVALTAKQVA